MHSEYTGDSGDEDEFGVTSDIKAIKKVEYDKGFDDGKAIGKEEGWNEAYAEGWGDFLVRLKIYHESGEGDIAKWIAELEGIKGK